MSVLAEKFGSRKVTIAGSVIACVGFLLSTQATSIEMLIVTWGVIGGMYMSFHPAVFVCVLFWGKEWCLWMGVFKGVEIWTSEAAAMSIGTTRQQKGYLHVVNYFCCYAAFEL